MSNKLYSEESIQAIANSIRAKNGTSETYTVSEMSTAISALPTNLTTKTITANGTYNASSDDADGYSSVTVAVEGYAKKSIANTPTPIATFNASALPMPSLKVGIEAVQSGSGDPSPTNVRPITGWSAVNRYRCGDTTELPYFVNSSKGIYRVVDMSSLIWTYTTSLFEDIGIFKATIDDMPEGSTTFSCPLYENVGTRSYLTTKDMTMSRLNSSSSVVLVRNDSYTSATAFKTAMSGVKLMYELIEPTAPTVTPSEMQAIMSSYNVTSQVYTTTLKDGQGNPLTCYGGELSNENGVQSLKNKDNEVDMGSLTWNVHSSGAFYASPTGIKYNSTVGVLANIMCSNYKNVDISSLNGHSDEDNVIYGIYLNAYIAVRDSRYTTASDFKTAMSGVQLVYELATPQTIPQDNLPIATQDGTNNIWADSGDIQSGEYMEAL